MLVVGDVVMVPLRYISRHWCVARSTRNDRRAALCRSPAEAARTAAAEQRRGVPIVAGV